MSISVFINTWGCAIATVQLPFECYFFFWHYLLYFNIKVDYGLNIKSANIAYIWFFFQNNKTNILPPSSKRRTVMNFFSFVRIMRCIILYDSTLDRDAKYGDWIWKYKHSKNLLLHFKLIHSITKQTLKPLHQ